MPKLVCSKDGHRFIMTLFTRILRDLNSCNLVSGERFRTSWCSGPTVLNRFFFNFT